MISLYDGLLTSLLPSHLSGDPSTQAFAFALRAQLRKMLTLISRACIWTRLDQLDGQTCDAVAAQLRTPNYDDTYPIETRRALVAGTITYYVRAGTPAALTDAVGAIFGDGEIEEWFDYGGNPFLFRVSTTNPAVTDENVSKFEEACNNVKRLTAHLDGVQLLLTTEPLEILTAVGLCTGTNITLKMQGGSP